MNGSVNTQTGHVFEVRYKIVHPCAALCTWDLRRCTTCDSYVRRCDEHNELRRNAATAVPASWNFDQRQCTQSWGIGRGAVLWTKRGQNSARTRRHNWAPTHTAYTSTCLENTKSPSALRRGRRWWRTYSSEYYLWLRNVARNDSKLY